MAVPYTVVSGDTLASIAKRFGLRSWQTLYYAPANAVFRARRPNPDAIVPGDVLVIPEGGGVRLCGRGEIRTLDPLAAAGFLQRVR